jgi:hypothetical protein
MIRPLVALVTAAGISLAPSGTLGGGIQSLHSPLTRSPPAQAPAPKPAAPASISTEVVVLHATNNNSGIDPKIGRMPALGKPPFSSFNSYKLLSRTSVPLDRGRAAAFKLPSGRELRVVYKDVIPPSQQGQAPRYVVTASILHPGGKPVLPLVEVKAKPYEWFWVGGQAYQGGSLFIGIKVAP